MDKQTFSVLYEDVQHALTDSRLSDALHALEGLVTFTGNWECKSALMEIKESYGMLLDYMSRGFVDPEREKLYRQFVRRAYEIAEITYRDALLKDSDSHYASVWNILTKMPQPTTLPGLMEQGGSYRQLFEVAWTGPLWQKSDYEAAHQIMESERWQEYERCVLLSGVTMAALQVFDAQRLKFLLDLAVSPVPAFRVRALVGVVLIYLKHAERCHYYAEVEAQLRLMADLPGFVSMLQTLQMQLFLSLETKKIEKSLREEILPEVMKKAKNIHLDKSLGFEDLQEKLSDQDLNPEWDENGKPSELGKKMKELAEMQQKGADVYIGSFKMFKQKFPFFSVAANWFCPFTFHHPDLDKKAEDNAFLKAFLSTGNLCDSDKYSFCLMMQEMPATQSDILRQQMDAAIGSHGDALQAAIQQDSEKKAELLMRSYVQDLYRYFTLFRYRDARENPFGMNLLLTDYKPFDEILSNVDTLQELADFTFKEKSYLYALKFYEHLPESAANYQKIGFCHQSVKDYQQAVEAYEKANLLKSDSAWTLRQLGQCYRALGDFEKALRYYEELEPMATEDVSLLLRLSECYLHLKNYDKAFEKLYKADYLAPEGGTALRALAWCSLLTDKTEQACRYYDKILAGSPCEEDYLNAGHAAWLHGEIAVAVAHYKKVVQLRAIDFAPADFFGDDAKVLQEKGKTEFDLHLMIDALNKDVMLR